MLHIGAYTQEFNIANQMDALTQACGSKGPDHTKMIASDNPEFVDQEILHMTFRDAINSSDPLHLALNAEKVSAGHKTEVSKCLRVCIVKLRLGLDDGRPYFRATARVPSNPDFARKVAGMGMLRAQRQVEKIMSDDYSQEAYASALEFVHDIAAVVRKHRRWMEKRPKNKIATAFGSIAHAMSARHLEYLLNFARFVARNPKVDVPFGTTPNEAFHNELKAYFRGIYTPSRSRIVGASRVITSVKLIAGMAKKANHTKTYSQSMLLREYCAGLESNPLKFDPPLVVTPQPCEPVDISEYDPRAKGVGRRHGVNKRPSARSTSAFAASTGSHRATLPCVAKRPAADVQRARKRPATGSVASRDRE